METIDIKEMLDYFKSKILIIIIPFILLLLIGGIYTAFIQTPKYESTSSIVLIGGSEETINSNDVNMNQNLVDTYAQIVKSKKILNKVRKELNLNYSYEELLNKVNVTSVNDTEIINISVITTNRKESYLIANASAKIFVEEIPNLYNISNVNILDKAEIATKPCNINAVKQELIAGMLGLVIGLGIVFIMFYFDRTVKTGEQIEKLELTLLGTVQEYNKKKKKKRRKKNKFNINNLKIMNKKEEEKDEGRTNSKK